MGTTADYLTQLIDSKSDIKAAIEEKGVTVSGGLSTYADAIRQINSGNGGYYIPSYVTFQGSNDISKLSKYTFEKRTSCEYMFYKANFKDASILKDILDTSDIVDMEAMFAYCEELEIVPLLDTSKVVQMESMFYGCNKLTIVPQFDTSNVTNMKETFLGCDNLTELPEFNAENLVMVNNIFGANMPDTVWEGLKLLTNIGGFKDFGKSTVVSGTKTYGFLYSLPNLTHTSLMNVINNLYDRSTESKYYYTPELKFHPNHFDLLTEDELAIVTNKGWVVT